MTPPEKVRAPRPLSVALTGGIGAGKTEALRAFERRGVPVLSADEIVHRLIAEDADVRSALEDRFGTTERPRIAETVFTDPNELAWLEGLLHPLVAREEEKRYEELAGQPEPPPVCVAEIPLLFEAGGEDRFDAVVVITASEEVRAARATLPADSRASRLMPDEEKVARADFSYVNDGTLDQLDAFVGDVLQALLDRSRA